MPNAHLLVAGAGPLQRALEQRAAELGLTTRASFLGFVADMRAFMNACDLLVFPTLPELSEGFGLSALEAMAAGRPVVATRVGSLPEVVLDGETGVIVDPASVAALSDALARMIDGSDLREQMGRSGARRAQQVFSLERMTDATLDLYCEVLAEVR
jgi:glycosyltransferase involved in cell wall biosynthesis